ncbi:ABC transporter permease [Virgibacillus proomii]|uniref:ABC transporter permease n=1 Tax=Virgibacillus proomii TaxID=84407 RepID=UPI001C0FD458|nr:ABC transporter permease [Virgibacillus proomii]MBU5267526.1 ABC transporter permease [Virgibacillus proomii]
MLLAKNGFFHLLRWQLLRMKPVLALYLIIQTLLAVGIVIGFSYLIPNIDDTTALYLTTGAPTIILLSIGLVFLPQGIAETRVDGTFTYMLSLPLPRLYYVLVEATIWLLISFPGIFIALFVASLRFDLQLVYSYKNIFTFILIGLTAIGIGYTISLWLRPIIAELISQVLIFGILLFSPINFPPDRLPNWLAKLHEFLPIQYMAESIRATLAPNDFEIRWSSFSIISVWCVLSFVMCYFAITKRK